MITAMINMYVSAGNDGLKVEDDLNLSIKVDVSLLYHFVYLLLAQVHPQIIDYLSYN